MSLLRLMHAIDDAGAGDDAKRSRALTTKGSLNVSRTVFVPWKISNVEN